MCDAYFEVAMRWFLCGRGLCLSWRELVNRKLCRNFLATLFLLGNQCTVLLAVEARIVTGKKNVAATYWEKRSMVQPVQPIKTEPQQAA